MILRLISLAAILSALFIGYGKSSNKSAHQLASDIQACNDESKSPEILVSICSRITKSKVPPKALYEALSKRAFAYQKLGDIPNAIDDVDAALQLKLFTSETLAFRARLLLQSGRTVEAEKDLDRALQIEPGNISASLIRADQYYNRAEWKQALSLYENALGKDPRHQYALKQTVKTQLELKQFTATANLIERALAGGMGQDSPYLFRILGLIQLKHLDNSTAASQSFRRYSASDRFDRKNDKLDGLLFIAEASFQAGQHGMGHEFIDAYAITFAMKPPVSLENLRDTVYRTVGDAALLIQWNTLTKAIGYGLIGEREFSKFALEHFLENAGPLALSAMSTFYNKLGLQTRSNEGQNLSEAEMVELGLTFFDRKYQNNKSAFSTITIYE